MKAARLIFVVAGVFGIAMLVPGLFIEAGSGLAFPELSNPEYYYGFYGSALVWQLGFLLIATDPIRYRPLMPIAALAKAGWLGTCLWLWQVGRLNSISGPFIGAMIDGLLMLAFLTAWWLTPQHPKGEPA